MNAVPKVQQAKRRDTEPNTDEVVAAPKSTARAEDVNALLDKISRDGMGSLSGDERELLHGISRKLRES